MSRSPDYWEGRADMTRIIAENVKDKGARETLLIIAAEYDALARDARKDTPAIVPDKNPWETVK